MKRVLTSAEIPSILEPAGCCTEDGKKPDGLTLTPWTMGKPMAWDFTCSNTVAKSYINATSKTAGEAARLRETVKRSKYQSLMDNFHFIPVSVETLGPFGKDAKELVSYIG